MMTHRDLRHAHKADLYFMRGDRAAMGRWLDQHCQHPYIGACVSRDGAHVIMILTERQDGDAGASAHWADRSILDQDLTIARAGAASNSDWLVEIMSDNQPRAWYIVFDRRSDADAFKKLFRKPAEDEA